MDGNSKFSYTETHLGIFCGGITTSTNPCVMLNSVSEVASVTYYQMPKFMLLGKIKSVKGCAIY